MVNTLEEMKRLAEIVTGEPHHLDPQIMYAFCYEGGEQSQQLRFWGPDLDGEDWQVAQACRVIVAAFKLGVLTTAIREHYIHGSDERYFFQVENQKGNIEASVKGPDLLSASIAALLSGGGK